MTNIEKLASEVEVHTISKPVWDMTGGEKRKYTQKDHQEFLLDIIKKSDFDTAIAAAQARILELESERDRFKLDFQNNYKWRINLSSENENLKSELTTKTEAVEELVNQIYTLSEELQLRAESNNEATPNTGHSGSQKNDRASMSFALLNESRRLLTKHAKGEL